MERSSKKRANVDSDIVSPDAKRTKKITSLPENLTAMLVAETSFEPLPMEIMEKKVNLPLNFTKSNVEEVFSLYFTTEMLQKMVQNTNDYAEREGAFTREKEGKSPRPWSPVTIQEIQSFIGINIWMGLHKQPTEASYWNTNKEIAPIHYPISRSMSLKRYQQINRYLYCCTAAEKSFHPHEKVEEIAQIFRNCCKNWYKPGTLITRKNDEFAQKTWGNLGEKMLDISVLAHLYNMYMNGVDIRDQLASYYSHFKQEIRTWKPLFRFLLETAVINAYIVYKLANDTDAKASAHSEFRKQLSIQLMKKTSSKQREIINTNQLDYTEAMNRFSQAEEGQKCGGIHVKIIKNPLECKICQLKRKEVKLGRNLNVLGSLAAAEINSLQNTNNKKEKRSRTRYGCSVCKIAICKESSCFREHIDSKLSSE